MVILPMHLILILTEHDRRVQRNDMRCDRVPRSCYLIARILELILRLSRPKVLAEKETMTRNRIVFRNASGAVLVFVT